ncbi:MAG: hypothetical protein HN368_12750 [Spirochaetales bacterium]|nr:hypothetical protein [Spirochaetales bacterium]
MVNPITGEDTTVSNKWAKGKSSKKLPEPIDAHHLWFSHKTPRRRMSYLAVVAPSKRSEARPVITPVSDTAVRVSFRGKETTISFGKDKADIAVDTEAVMP